MKVPEIVRGDGDNVVYVLFDGEISPEHPGEIVFETAKCRNDCFGEPFTIRYVDDLGEKQEQRYQFLGGIPPRIEKVAPESPIPPESKE